MMKSYTLSKAYLPERGVKELRARRHPAGHCRNVRSRDLWTPSCYPLETELSWVVAAPDGLERVSHFSTALLPEYAAKTTTAKGMFALITSTPIVISKPQQESAMVAMQIAISEKTTAMTILLEKEEIWRLFMMFTACHDVALEMVGLFFAYWVSSARACSRVR